MYPWSSRYRITIDMKKIRLHELCAQLKNEDLKLAGVDKTTGCALSCLRLWDLTYTKIVVVQAVPVQDLCPASGVRILHGHGVCSSDAEGQWLA